MGQKKKIIWWEREAEVGSADEARQRGASEGSGRRRRTDSPYYGPVTLGATDLDVTGAEPLDRPVG